VLEAGALLVLALPCSCSFGCCSHPVVVVCRIGVRFGCPALSESVSSFVCVVGHKFFDDLRSHMFGISVLPASLHS
jgi:hypothetical protein